MQKGVVALGLLVGTSGCVIGQRIEKFSKTYPQVFASEYAKRTDPNTVSEDRYSSLRRMGELQLRVSQGFLSRREALDRLEKEDYDRAFDAVQAIARSAFQDSIRLTSPEVRLVERFTTFEPSRPASDDMTDFLNPRIHLGTSFSDMLKPRLNMGSSVSNGAISLEPSLRFGRLYSVSYSTKNERFEHSIRYRYHDWSFRIDVDHTMNGLVHAGGRVSYAFDGWTSANLSYYYVSSPVLG